MKNNQSNIALKLMQIKDKLVKKTNNIVNTSINDMYYNIDNSEMFI